MQDYCIVDAGTYNLTLMQLSDSLSLIHNLQDTRFLLLMRPYINKHENPRFFAPNFREFYESGPANFEQRS